MDCDIYTFAKQNEVYLFIEAGKNISDCVPQEIIEHFGETFFFQSTNFDPSPFIVTNSKEVIKNIKEKKYHLLIFQLFPQNEAILAKK